MANPITIPVTQTGFQQSIQAGAKAAGQINIPVNATFNAGSFNNLAQPLGRVTGLATEFEKSIAASNARVIAFGASVGIINGIQNAFANLVTTTIEVQKSLTLIGAISNKSGQELEKFGDGLFEVAKNTGQSFKVAAEAATEFARQGLSVEETLRRTSDALTLTRFTSLSAADSVDVLTAAVNSFSDAGVTTADILNKLVAVDTKFAVSAADLANGLSRAGAIAQEVGVSLDELNGIITSVQQSTARGGAVIGNAFKTIFTNIRSEGTIKALQEVGIYSTEASGKLKPVVPILQELAEKLNNLSETKRLEVLESIASKYNINVLSALLGDINKAGGAFQQSKGTSAEATNEAYQRQLELNKSLSIAFNNVYISSEKLANSIGRIGVTENLKGLLDFFGNLIDSVNDVVDSEGIGGNIARGLISGLGSIFFKVGIPVLAALFVVLTKNIIQFGSESLQTILGINSKVKERQALEQAVFNTLVQNQNVMANISALSGDRAKQEQYLLSIYNQQLAAIQKVRDVAASVAPGLQSGGLSAITGQITKTGKRAAGGYLPAQEAADVSRGVGGASSSSKVVSIPNFAFGGGKKGTMIANTSEYVVPNFANGGSAIFNQDMVNSFGLPAGARKLSAAGGYIPNFAKYIYDSDRIPADKNATLKAILASSAKKNLLIAPAGAGKSTFAAGMGKFLTGAADVANATEIDILSGAGRTKDGGLSKNLESIMAAVNSTGGKVSYLYTKNLDILSRRAGRTDPSEGDLRSKKQLAGTAYAPLNQFDFMGMVKSRAKSFDMIRGAKGYIPNFAEELTKFGASRSQSRYAAMVGEKIPADLEQKFVGMGENKELEVRQTQFKNSKLIQFPVVGLPAKSSSNIDSLEDRIEEFGKGVAVDFATNLTGGEIPKEKLAAVNNTKFNPGSLAAFAGTLFEASVGSMLGDKGFADYNSQSIGSAFDIKVNDQLKQTFPSLEGVDYVELKGRKNKQLMDSVAKKIYQVTEGQRAAQSTKKLGDKELKELAMSRGVALSRLKPISNLDAQRPFVIEDGKITEFDSRQELENYVFSKYTTNIGKRVIPSTTPFDKNVLPKRGAAGYIPNFAKSDPLEDAVKREIDAGVDPTTIRVTKAGRLKNAENPSGLAVINTRDEPDGKIPNFAKPLTKNPKGIYLREGTNQPASKNEIEAFLLEEQAISSGSASRVSSRPTGAGAAGAGAAGAGAGAGAGAAGAGAGSGEKQLDIGKFLIFQTALVGATGAIQSFTKEGSNASMALEAGAGLANVVGTTMMVLKSGLGPIGIALTVATTALTALGPLFLKFSASLETETDRVRKSLADLADQAKKTGQAVTPEAFLAAFDKAKKEEKGKNEANSNEKIINEVLQKQNIQLINPDDIKSIIAALQATGGTVDGKTDATALNNLILACKDTRQTEIIDDTGNLSSVANTDFFDPNKMRAYAAPLALKEIEKNRGSVAQKQGMTDQEKANQTYDSKQLVFRQKILEQIFSQELTISNQAAETALKREKELSHLDQTRGRLTELAAIEQERTIELAKINDEQERFNSLKLNSVRTGLGAGAKDSVLSQEALYGANDLQLQTLMDAFAESSGPEGNTEQYKAQLDSFLRETGALKGTGVLDSAAEESITKALRDIFEASRKQDASTTNQRAAVGQKFDIATTNTTAAKQNRTIQEYTERAGGGAKYDELLANAKRDLTISLLAAKEKNKISIDSAEENAKSQFDLAISNEQAQIEIFKRVKVDTDAATDASKLRTATNEKVRQFQKDGLNAQLKFDTDGELIDAESKYLDALYGVVSVQEEAVQEGKKLTIQSRKNRRQAEVTAKNQKQLFDEDVAQIQDKILIAKAFQEDVKQKDLNLKASKELELESLNLARASGELAAQYNNLAAKTANEKESIKNQLGSEIISTISKGDAYSGTSINLREQARASVLKQNLEGKKFEDLSLEERSNLTTGKANTIGQNLKIEGSGLLDEAKTFQQILGQDTPKALADGLAQAMQVGLSGADNIGEALEGIAKSFLQTLQTAFLQSASNKIVGSTLAAIGGSEGGYVKKFAAGGMVTGGSGIRDDVPAMLSAGEYVIRKSAVQKYGAENIAKMNNGGIFLPGVRGGSAISGYDQLSKFANQTTTSGATDVLKGSGSTAFANLEDQSARLSRFGLMNEDTIKGEVTSAQQQGLDLISKREAYRTQQRKAMQQQIISTVASAALAYGASKIPTKTSGVTGSSKGLGLMDQAAGKTQFLSKALDTSFMNFTPTPGKAYGGLIRKFNNGGGPTDDIPALLMGGEYVMDRATVRKYGKQYLDSMNTGRARFAEGGYAGVEAETATESSDSKAKVDSKTGTAVTISIHVSGSSSSTESQGQTSQGGVDYKKMGERIKAVVLETINEEKRLGGALRSR